MLLYYDCMPTMCASSIQAVGDESKIQIGRREAHVVESS